MSQAGWKGNGAGRRAALARALDFDRPAPEFTLVVRNRRQGRATARARRVRRFRVAECNSSMAGKMRRAEKRLRTPLISTAELASRLSAPDWFVADCRFDLGKPRGRRASPGAPATFPAQSTSTSSATCPLPVTPTTGRHPLPTPRDFARTLSRLGIGNETPRRLLRRGPWRLSPPASGGCCDGWGTTRSRCSTADSPPGLPRAGRSRPTRRRARTRPLQSATRGRRWSATQSDVKRALARGETLVDVRGAERFAGSVEPIDAVAGHVPGAVNLPFLENLGANGRFRAPAEIAELWQLAHRRGAGPGADLHVRFGRHGLPGPARARGRGNRRRPALRGLVERVDPRPVAAGSRAGAT